MSTASRARSAVAAFAFALACVPASSAGAAGERDFEVHVETVGDEIRTRASLFVRASRQRVWEVITDYERAPQFTRDLEVSKVLSRSGDTLRVFQKNQIRFGPFAIPIETVRDVRLAAPVRSESRLVSGSMEKYDATTVLVAEAGGTRINYRSMAIPGTGLALFASDARVKRETEAHFMQLRAEILRREHLARAGP